MVSLRLAFPGDQLKVQVWKTCRDPEVIFRQCPTGSIPETEIDVEFNTRVTQGQMALAFRRFVDNYEQRIARSYKHTDLLVPLASFCGRSKPKLVLKPFHCPMVRHPRNGEYKSTVDDAPLKFRQHIKQLRRVQTVVLQLRSFIKTQFESAKGAALETWCAILAANGYPETFTQFALEQWGIAIPGFLEPQHLPIVELLFENMKVHQTSWEYQIAKLRQHKYKASMESDWNKGGRAHALEVKPPPKQEISMLEIPYQMRITRLRHHKTGPFWITCHETVPPGVQFVLQGETKFHILECKEKNLRLDKPLPGPRADCDVLLLAPTTDLVQVTALTMDFWRKFWFSRDEPDLDEVCRLLTTIPPVPCFEEEITEREVVEAIGKSKSSRARGPDNWSNEDLKNLDSELIRQLVALFNGFQLSGEWPPELLDATVALLPKEYAVTSLDQTRPVTILSVLYRLWSKIITTKFLRQVLRHLPDSIHGNKPQSSSVWLATYIQLQVEFALGHNQQCNVASLDLKKAFNLLSRAVLRNTCPHFGVPDSVTALHQSFLGGLRRHFRIMNNVTQPIESTTGVPEGCGFSVCCVMQLNWIVTARLQEESRLCEKAQYFSYVDNWLFMSACHHKIRNSLAVTEAFASQAGYVISPGKTWVSSTSKKVRQSFGSFQVAGTRVSTPVHKVEVGLLLRFNLSPCIQPVLDRWEAGIKRVERLVYKNWSHSRKISVIRKVVLPQLFAGVQSVHVSLSMLKRIRGKFNVAIHSAKTAASHFLSPLFTSKDDYEPFLYIFRTRLSALRATLLSFRTDVTTHWNSFVGIDLVANQTKILGPLSCFLWGCQVLGWQVHPDLVVVTWEAGTYTYCCPL